MVYPRFLHKPRKMNGGSLSDQYQCTPRLAWCSWRNCCSYMLEELWFCAHFSRKSEKTTADLFYGACKTVIRKKLASTLCDLIFLGSPVVISNNISNLQAKRMNKKKYLVFWNYHHWKFHRMVDFRLESIWEYLSKIMFLREVWYNIMSIRTFSTHPGVRVHLQ